MIRYRYTGEGSAGFERYHAGHRPEFLCGLFFSMLRIRRIEEEIERRYHQDQMKTPIHLVIGQEATVRRRLRRAAETRSPLFEPPHARQLPRQGRRSEARCCARCTAASTAASGRAAARCTSSTRRVGMAGTSAIVGGAVPIAVGAALAAQMKGEDRVVDGVSWRCDDGGRRHVREPQLRRAQAGADRLLLREQFLFGAVAALHAAAAARFAPLGRDAIRCPRSRSTASTCSRCTTRRRTRSRAPEPATARRSSRRRSTGSARTAAPATTARPAIATSSERAAWEAFDPIHAVRTLPQGEELC